MKEKYYFKKGALTKRDAPGKWDLSAAGHISALFIVRKDIDENIIVLQKSEVDEVKFVDKKEYNRMLNDGEMAGTLKYCGKILDYIK